MIHDAQNHGEDAPPVPRANTWFPDEANSPASRRRRNNTTDNTNNGDEESDDEIIIESATTNLKCCLTLQYFKEPYSTNICPHTFEKFAIVEYYDKNGTVFQGPGSDDKKRFKCPQSGCDKVSCIT
jgi:SUMO ligase MMS21 Smc5/6 complex component